MHHVMYEVLRGIRWLEEKILEERHRFHHKWGCVIPHYLGFTFFINNIKISSTMSKITVPFGTPVTGKGSGIDVKGNILADSTLQAGSAKFSSSDESIFTVSQDGNTETKFSLLQVAVGSAKLLFNAKDINGVDLPQAESDITLTEVIPVAVGLQIDFDTVGH